MKQKIFTLLLLSSIALVSCRKNNNDPDIKQYDQIQIQNYINANGLTDMKRDTTDGDTTGMYYQILGQGRGDVLQYSDNISIVFTIKSFDGKYNSLDSLTANHYYGFLGHLTSASTLPKGLQIAIHNLLKYKGTRARILIPSHLAFGINGYGSGSSTNVNTRILGNQCLDFYVNVISNQEVYDDQIINAYMTRNSLSGYTKFTDGLYVKVLTPGTTGGDIIGDGSAFTAIYTGKYLNDVVFDNGVIPDGENDFTYDQLTTGVKEAVKDQTTGSVLSIFVPSRLGYGTDGSSGITANTSLHFDFQIKSVTNP